MCHRVMCHNSGGVSHALMQRRRCVFVRPRCFSRTPVARGSLGIWSFFSAARDHLAAPQSQVHRPDCAIESCDMAASSDHVFDPRQRSLDDVGPRYFVNFEVRRYGARAKKWVSFAPPPSSPALLLLLRHLLRYPSPCPTGSPRSS
jgi:hypothetical protein